MMKNSNYLAGVVTTSALVAGLLCGCQEVSRDAILVKPGTETLAAAIVRAHAEGKHEIILDDGVWHLDEPVVLTAADNGMKIRARHRGKAVISGAPSLVWRPLGRDEMPQITGEARKHVQVAEVKAGMFPANSGIVGGADLPNPLMGDGFPKPELPGFDCGGWRPNASFVHEENPLSLYKDGKRLVPARWPDKGFKMVLLGGKSAQGNFKDGRVAFDDKARLQKWKDEPDLYAMGLWDVKWADLQSRVTAVDPENGFFAISFPFGARTRGARAWFYVLNAFSELDCPGEWAVDRKARKIYAWADKPEVALSAGLVKARGVRDVTFDGIVFEYSRCTAIQFHDCTNMLVNASAIRHCSTDAVMMASGKGCRVEGSDLTDLGEGGVAMYGGNQDTLTPSEHVVDNCEIGHFGQNVWNYQPAVTMHGVGGRVTHNLIHHTKHQAVDFRGNDMYIGYNVCHDLCMFNEDAGGIYCYMGKWTERGSVVEYNLVQRLGSGNDRFYRFGIYLDWVSTGITVRGNIVADVEMGIFSAGGQDNRVIGNLVLNSNQPVKKWNYGIGGPKRKPRLDTGRGLKSTRWASILANRPLYESELWRKRYPNMMRVFEFDDIYLAQCAHFVTVEGNVYAGCGKPEYVDLDLCRETRITNNLEIATDPGFVDLEHLNYTLKPGTPGYKALGGPTKFAEMGLYDSARRFSPVRKYAPDVSAPWPGVGEPAREMKVRADIWVKDKLPAGVCFATNHVNCWQMPAPDWVARRIETNLGNAPIGEYADYAFSFTPTIDCTADFMLMGECYNRATQYDDIRIEGAELVNGDFEAGEKGWVWAKNARGPAAYEQHYTQKLGVLHDKSGKWAARAFQQVDVSQRIKLTKGRRVTVRMKAMTPVDR